MDYGVVKEFGNLANWRDFLNEQINNGDEISRGKNPLDKSKEAKAAEQDQEQPDQMQAPVNPPVPVAIDPTQAPGSQIAIGKKEVQKEADPKSIEIKISGKKEQVDLKPKIKKRHDQY